MDRSVSLPETQMEQHHCDPKVGKQKQGVTLSPLFRCSESKKCLKEQNRICTRGVQLTVESILHNEISGTKLPVEVGHQWPASADRKSRRCLVMCRAEP